MKGHSYQNTKMDTPKGRDNSTSVKTVPVKECSDAGVADKTPASKKGM